MVGPIAASKTARQKYRRAFAQSLLCPYESLIEYIGRLTPDEGDIAAAARYFHVSERVVRTVLVNKHILPRDVLLNDGIRDSSLPGFDAWVETA